MKLNLGCGDRPLDGFVNLDAREGWRFEDGLGLYPDASVSAITVSHSLMYVGQPNWPAVFKEFRRVLKRMGVVRITEDSTDDPRSERFGGHYDAVTLTTADLVARHLYGAGFAAWRVAPDESRYWDDSLIQRWHGDPPKVFFMEGIAV